MARVPPFYPTLILCIFVPLPQILTKLMTICLLFAEHVQSFTRSYKIDAAPGEEPRQSPSHHTLQTDSGDSPMVVPQALN